MTGTLSALLGFAATSGGDTEHPRWSPPYGELVVSWPDGTRLWRPMNGTHVFFAARMLELAETATHPSRVQDGSRVMFVLTSDDDLPIWIVVLAALDPRTFVLYRIYSHNPGRWLGHDVSASRKLAWFLVDVLGLDTGSIVDTTHGPVLRVDESERLRLGWPEGLEGMERSKLPELQAVFDEAVAEREQLLVSGIPRIETTRQIGGSEVEWLSKPWIASDRAVVTTFQRMVEDLELVEDLGDLVVHTPESPTRISEGEVRISQAVHLHNPGFQISSWTIFVEVVLSMQPGVAPAWSIKLPMSQGGEQESEGPVVEATTFLEAFRRIGFAVTPEEYEIWKVSFPEPGTFEIPGIDLFLLLDEVPPILWPPAEFEVFLEQVRSAG